VIFFISYHLGRPPFLFYLFFYMFISVFLTFYIILFISFCFSYFIYLPFFYPFYPPPCLFHLSTILFLSLFYKSVWVLTFRRLQITRSISPCNGKQFQFTESCWFFWSCKSVCKTIVIV
jgi:hypothetical protein